MVDLILLCVVVAFVAISWNYYWARLENRLREQPPERVWFKLSLGRGVKDSEKRMRRSLRAFAAKTHASNKDRRSGARQLRFVAVAKRPSPDAQPLICTYVACDIDLADALQSALQEQFGSKLGIQKVDDPLRTYRPPAPADELMTVTG